MVEREGPQNLSHQKLIPKSVSEVITPDAPPAMVAFLKLAAREGAYSLLSERIRQRLDMHFLQGMSLTEIAGFQKVTKQAISQSLKLAPESLYKQMSKDVVHRRTTISFKEILSAYSAYRIYYDAKKKKRGII
jgi:DNA-directed RNA polymerase specialized sigma24 family protein